MQLGKTLVGGIIGAALGIGLLLVVFLLAGLDKVWLAIPVALLTGLGVRTMVSTSGHPSYLRGAITVVLALAAYLGGWLLVAKVANYQAKKAPMPMKVAEAGKEEAGAEAKTDEPAPPPVVAAPVPTRMAGEAGRRPAMPAQYSTWDIISLFVAALVAYELGRGTGGAPRDAMSSAPDGTVPAGTHPDA